jgi:hypothetical protein
MAARKSAKDAADAPKTKKASAKKAPRKATSKKASTKPSAKAAKADEPQAAESAKAEPRKGGDVSSQAVNLGHVFALRPRVPKSFRQADFQIARDRLRDESYDSIEAAARAVVEKALELTRKPTKRGARR